MGTHPQGGGFRTIARATLGAFLFLLVASFIAIPCMATRAPADALFSSVGGPQACQERKLFKPRADLSRLEPAQAEPAFRFLVALPVLAAASALAAPAIAEARARLRRGAPVRHGTLPFATADPPKLPAFAALRDA
jgi:hypothetical protein